MIQYMGGGQTCQNKNLINNKRSLPMFDIFQGDKIVLQNGPPPT